MLSIFKRKCGFGKSGFKIDKKQPLSEVAFSFIDTELTGLNPRNDSIISFGALKMTGGRIEIGNSFYSLVNPRSKIGSKSILIHTITPAEVEKERKIEDVIKEFLEFCGCDVLGGHCVCIDLEFINKEMKQSLGFTLHNPVLDTFALYSWLWQKWSPDPGFSLPPHQLDLYRMADAFGISTTGAHNAVMDAFITAQVFQRFVPWLEKSGIRNLEELLRVGNPFRGGVNCFSSPGRIDNL